MEHLTLRSNILKLCKGMVDQPKLDQVHFYIPHHCVFKPKNTITRLTYKFAKMSKHNQNSAILVEKKDRRFKYVLWRKTPLNPLRTFELNTELNTYELNTYGTASEPFLAIRSMTYLAYQYSNKFKFGA